MWYWARTRDKASHGSIPIPLGYRGHGHSGKTEPVYDEWIPSNYIFEAVGNLVDRASSSDRKAWGAKFEQISEFEPGRIIGLREAGLSYRAVAARGQHNSSTIMRVSKQWTDESRTARKSGSGPRNVTSARDDRRLV
ncbi:transposable element Tc1 transposase [Trichonephila clavipes]|nr:transposable element Tc1 transposase [Trichonephila clavipes]